MTTERHHGPALWLVAGAIVVATVLAVSVGARAACWLLAATCAASAVARLLARGRRPEGLAVRSTWVDVTVLTGLAIGLAVLALSPDV